MKKCVIIGASSESIHSINIAKKEGLYVIAMDGNHDAEGLKYADKSYVVDIRDFNQIDKIIVDEKPDYTLTVPIGRYLTATGYVDDKWKIKGITFDNAETSVDKLKFHERLFKNGLRNIKVVLINKEVDIEKIDINYPCIAKPRYGSGSRDIFYLQDKKDLARYIDCILSKNEDFLLEEFVEGEEYSVDGIVAEGKLYVSLLRKKVMTHLPHRQAVAYISVDKNECGGRIYEIVQKKLEKIVCCLGYKDCLLQNDLLINGGDVFVIEMAPRPTGHYVHDIFAPEATGIDLAQEYLKYLMGNNHIFVGENVRKLIIKYFDFSNVKIKRVPNISDLQKQYNIVKWRCNIAPGDIMEDVTNGHSIMGRGFFILEGKSDDELISKSQKILSEFILNRIGVEK